MLFDSADDSHHAWASKFYANALEHTKHQHAVFTLARAWVPVIWRMKLQAA